MQSAAWHQQTLALSDDQFFLAQEVRSSLRVRYLFSQLLAQGIVSLTKLLRDRLGDNALFWHLFQAIESRSRGVKFSSLIGD
jgi:hypothetical protein